MAQAVGQGAHLATGGVGPAPDGTRCEPTVPTAITPALTIERAVTFGPVSAIVRFEDEDEAIAAPNDTDFGLAAYVSKLNPARTFRLTEALNHGLITPLDASFGGLKEDDLS